MEPHWWPRCGSDCGVSGHKGKDYVGASDSTCDLPRLLVGPGEVQQVPKGNLNPFHNPAV